MTGIYIIENTKNGKVYIGQVGQGKNTNFTTRFNNHYKSLTRGKHKNKHLQGAWNCDGEENFTFDILEIVDNKDLLNKREEFWVEYYKSNSAEFGYNKTKGGDCKSKEYVFTLKDKQKLSKKMKEVMSNPEVRAKISKNNAMKNNPEVRKKSAQSRIGLPGTMLGKEAWNKGKTGIYSEETLKRMSEVKKGKTYSKETKEKISKAKSGPNGWNWVEPTQEMIDDIKNGMKRNDFYRKYKLSKCVWLKIKNLYLKEG